jgi:hypothetical protein
VQDITAWYDHGEMASMSESEEIITELSPLNLYFELEDGSLCLVIDEYPMTENVKNYMYVYDDTPLYIESPQKSSRKSGGAPTHDLLHRIKETGRVSSLRDLVP